jgi:asparagine synthase (glutamine-hydrolysing)
MFGAFAPTWLWQLTNRAIGRRNRDVACYSAIRSDRLADLALRSLAKQRGHDFSYRPWNDGFAMRLGALRRFNQGNINKGTLAGWGIDRRDPTGDKRLLEFCLSVPTEAYLSKGIPRALVRRAMVDRLPRAVLKEARKGYQAVDWHEGLTAAHAEVTAELERLAHCPAAAGLLDMERLKRLAAHWPTSGWERGEVMEAYRLVLLRGIAAGHFLRKASQSN